MNMAVLAELCSFFLFLLLYFHPCISIAMFSLGFGGVLVIHIEVTVYKVPINFARHRYILFVNDSWGYGCARRCAREYLSRRDF